MKARLVIILVFAAGLGSLGLVIYYRAQQVVGTTTVVVKPAAVRSLTLTAAPYAVTESFYGLIEARARVDMAFQVSGRIDNLGTSRDRPLAENQKVQKGDVIARLEPQRYEAAVEQAKATMETAKAAMATASAQIAQVNAELQDAKSELKRLERLQFRDATTEREVEKAVLRVTLARARLDAARASLSSAQAAYRSARAEASMANINLQDTILRAPMDAVVAAVPAEVGQMVHDGDNVATLVDLDRVKLAVGVVERKVPLLREGQTVSVDLLALSSQADLLSDSKTFGRPREGVITVVPPAADPQTGLFNVEIELDNHDGVLNPGMIGKAIVTVMQTRAVAIPASAAARSGQRASAFFVDKGYQTGLDLGRVGSAVLDVPAAVARRVWFDPILFDRDHYLVTDLPEGMDQLIVEGHSRLGDGQTVKVINTRVQVSDTAAGR